MHLQAHSSPYGLDFNVINDECRFGNLSWLQLQAELRLQRPRDGDELVWPLHRACGVKPGSGAEVDGHVVSSAKLRRVDDRTVDAGNHSAEPAARIAAMQLPPIIRAATRIFGDQSSS
jgi:hypothetical protein